MNIIKKSLFRKRRKNEGRIKYLMWLSHLWIGLLSSLVVFIMCVTGCLYAFRNQIINLSNQDKIYVDAGAGSVWKPGQIQTELLKSGKELTRVLIPVKSNESYMVSYRENNLDKSVYFDPYTGKELGPPDTGSNQFFEVVLDIHRNLMMGNFGRQIVGVSILMFCFLLVSGFILWLPKKLKFLKQGLSIKWNAKFQRFNYDLHNTLGFYTCLMLFFIALTGLYVTYPWVKNAIVVSLGGESINNVSKETSGEDDPFGNLLGDMLEKQNEKKNMKGQDQVSIDKILELSDQHLPYKAVTSIDFPNKENPRYVVIKINTENLLGMMLPDEITFDKKGNLKTKEIFSDKPLNKQFVTLAKPLHTGEIMGLPSIILYFIVSFVACSLPITGFTIWRHRYNKLK
ncbi:PepSY-associated TM helix domain-containing protein [Chryseobacterium sp.]|uniref:PepSY-associated TM helix domain-containing protein n=1 Tax=Chryseobacterium sp. TaxID=1871047 RepID=UPI0025C58127|nr:PepSY-associated TM helix domain-containing protein [Chryseobacterium sp.]